MNNNQEETSSMGLEVIPVPEMIKLQSVEAFLESVAGVSGAKQVIFDFTDRKFFRPYGTMTIVLAARHLAKTTKRPVTFSNVSTTIRKYFQRINLFEMGKNWIHLTEFSTPAYYSPDSENLMELTAVSGYDDIVKILKRTDIIFSDWVNKGAQNDIRKVLDELCQNVQEHSGDSQVCMLIQKYSDKRNRSLKNVCIAIGDLGKGIRASLEETHGELRDSTLDYLHDVLEGITSRKTGRGGLGLPSTEAVAEKTGGYLWIRSETASIRTTGSSSRSRQGRTNLAYFPGTQVVAEFNFLS